MTELSLEEEQAIRDRCQKTNEGHFSGGLTIYNCPVCKKDFCVSCEKTWIFKRKRTKGKKYVGMIYLCSYSCSRKYEQVFG